MEEHSKQHCRMQSAKSRVWEILQDKRPGFFNQGMTSEGENEEGGRRKEGRGSGEVALSTFKGDLRVTWSCGLCAQTNHSKKTGDNQGTSNSDCMLDHIKELPVFGCGKDIMATFF